MRSNLDLFSLWRLKMLEKERLDKLTRANDLQSQLIDARTELAEAVDDEERYRWTCEIDDLEWELEEIYTRLDSEGDGK